MLPPRCGLRSVFCSDRHVALVLEAFFKAALTASEAGHSAVCLAKAAVSRGALCSEDSKPSLDHLCCGMSRGLSRAVIRVACNRARDDHGAHTYGCFTAPAALRGANALISLHKDAMSLK